MKAFALTEIKTPLELQSRPDPTPGPGEVVVKLKAASLNRRDYWITQGMYPGIEPPVVLGSDGAGIVSQLGEGVDQSWQDTEVITNPGINWGTDQNAQSNDFHILGSPLDGTFSTEVVVPAGQLFHKPEHLSWQEAAAIPLAGVTAYRAVMSRGNLQAGENVLITGIGGGVATFALQFALARKAQVWVTSSSQAKIDQAIEAGAAGGLLYTEEGWAKSLAKSAGQPNLIIDSAGGANYRDLINIAAPGARIVNYGATTGPPEKLDMFKLFWKQLCLLGTTMGSPADFASMLQLVNEHKIKPIIDQVFPFEETNSAIELMAKSPQFGKYVIQID